MTYKQILDGSIERMELRRSLSLRDGIGITLFKLVTRRFTSVWVSVFFYTLMQRLEQPSLRFAQLVYGPPPPLRYQFTIAVDLYKITMDCILIIAYILIYWSAKIEFLGAFSWVIQLACLLYALCRLVEVYSTIVYLYFGEGHRVKSANRALVNTLWHYLELTTAFAIFYIFLEQVNSSAFSTTSGISESFTTPWYFSFTTVSTLGYGDFSPTTWAGQILICMEVLMGFFLLLIILQRSFAQQEESLEVNSMTYAVDHDGFLGIRHDPYNIQVGVIVIIQSSSGEYLTVRKSPKKGYEFSDDLCFPGGMVRAKHGISDTFKLITSSAIDRVFYETGLKIDGKFLVPFNSLCPIATTYTVKGQRKDVLVVAFTYQLQEKRELLTNDDSVSDAFWTKLPGNWTEYSPANAVFGAMRIWPSLSYDKRLAELNTLRPHLALCKSIAIDLNLKLDNSFEILLRNNKVSPCDSGT